MSACTQLNMHAHTLFYAHAFITISHRYTHACTLMHTKSKSRQLQINCIFVEYFYFLLKITFITVTVVQPIIII